MMAILRDRASGICMCSGAFRSNGSQVSLLGTPEAHGTDAGSGDGADGAAAPPAARHWFTGTPDPQRGIFKPFVFGAAGGALDGSPHTAAKPAARNPPHALWQAWQAAYEQRHGGGSKPAAEAVRELEARCLDPQSSMTFAAAVGEEMRLYGREA